MAKKAITWTELLALDPCEAGLEAALEAFPEWPSQPPTWEEVLAREEGNGYRMWLVSRILDRSSAVEWARLCAASVEHLQSIAANWAAGAADAAATTAYWATAAAAAAAYWATAAAYWAAEAAYAVSSVPSVYALALPFLEAM